MGFFERVQQGAEAGWEGIKETVKNGGNFFAGGEALEEYLNRTVEDTKRTDEDEE